MVNFSKNEGIIQSLYASSIKPIEYHVAENKVFTTNMSNIDADRIYNQGVIFRRKENYDRAIAAEMRAKDES